MQWFDRHIAIAIHSLPPRSPHKPFNSVNIGYFGTHTSKISAICNELLEESFQYVAAPLFAKLLGILSRRRRRPLSEEGETSVGRQGCEIGLTLRRRELPPHATQCILSEGQFQSKGERADYGQQHNDFQGSHVFRCKYTWRPFTGILHLRVGKSWNILIIVS